MRRFPGPAVMLFFKAPPVPARKVVLFFKASFKDQPGYALQEGPKGKNRWMREDGDTREGHTSERQNGRHPARRRGEIEQNTRMSEQIDSAPPAKLEHITRHQVSRRVSARFIAEMDDALQRIPSAVMDRIVESGNTLAFVETVFEARPDLHGKSSSSAQPGTAFENLRGFFDAKTKTIYVPEYYRPRHQLARGLVKNDMAAAVLRHEIGHALDHSLGLVSATPEFQLAYRTDIDEFDDDLLDDFAYFWQFDIHRNCREVFAEIIAVYYGGGPHDESRRIKSVFSCCDEVLQKQLRAIQR